MLVFDSYYLAPPIASCNNTKCSKGKNREEQIPTPSGLDDGDADDEMMKGYRDEVLCENGLLQVDRRRRRDDVDCWPGDSSVE